MREEIIDICRGHKNLDSSISEKLMALGNTSTEELINVATDIELLNVDSVGCGSIPVVAAQELACRKEEKAIKPLLALLKELDTLDMVMEDYRSNIASLLTLSSLEEVLEQYYKEEDKHFKKSLAYILLDSNIKDKRIYEILLNETKIDPRFSGFLADYGSQEAIPHIMEIFDSLEVNKENGFLNHEFIELEDAILHLGGTLTESQRKKITTVHQVHNDFRKKLFQELRASSRKNKIGRNSPCPCGSGKKYKKCCLLN